MFSLLPLVVLAGTVSAQTNETRAELAVNALQKWYNNSTGLWNTCGWWNGANCMTTLADLAKVDDSVTDLVVDVFNHTFVVAPAYNPIPSQEEVNGTSLRANASVWTDGSFDDDAWWALGWIAAYDVTHKQQYLDTAIGIWEQMTTDGPTTCGDGGIYSDHNRNYINAVTNELFLSVGAHLANRAHNGTRYLNSAKKQWEWFRDSGMINNGSTINDGLTETCVNNGETEWSYNQGIVLGGLAELHRATNHTGYLDSAHKIANATIKLLADENNVIHESCEPDDCDGNSTQFKGIYIRNLRLLHSVAPRDLYEDVIRACAYSIWANDRNNLTQFGADWSGPIATVDASSHSSAMDALVAVLDL